MSGLHQLRQEVPGKVQACAGGGGSRSRGGLERSRGRLGSICTGGGREMHAARGGARGAAEGGARRNCLFALKTTFAESLKDELAERALLATGRLHAKLLQLEAKEFILLLQDGDLAL